MNPSAAASRLELLVKDARGAIQSYGTASENISSFLSYFSHGLRERKRNRRRDPPGTARDAEEKSSARSPSDNLLACACGRAVGRLKMAIFCSRL